MTSGFIGRVTPAGDLKTALDAGSVRVRAIADRVSKASLGNRDGFALPPIPGSPASGAVNVEAEMTNLADEQLRFEATAKLLSKAYEQVRSSLK